MRRLLDTCGGQPFLLRAGGVPRAGRYFDPTSAAGVRASAARRSRRALVWRGSLLAKLSRARRDTRYLSPVALGPPRSHARARAVRHGRSAPVLRAPWRVAHGLRTNRHSVSPGWRAGSRVTRGRARVSSRSADSRRASRASARSFESKAFRIPRSAGPFTRAPLEAGIGARQRVTRRQAHAAARASGAPETAPTNTKPEQDSGSATRGGGGSGQHAVKRAAHARTGRSGTRTSR
jgi:hypothetical protein